MKKMLIALDDRPSAQKVAASGFLLGRNVDITLLHIIANPGHRASSVYDPIVGFGNYAASDLLGAGMVHDLKNKALEFLVKTKNHLADGDIKIMVKEGSVAESILIVAKIMQAEVIVMGSHSRRWLENISMGNITQFVLKHSSIPLLIIPVKAQE